MKAGDINVSVHVATRAVGGRLDGRERSSSPRAGLETGSRSINTPETPLSQDLHLGSHLELRIWADRHLRQAGTDQNSEIRVRNRGCYTGRKKKSPCSGRLSRRESSPGWGGSSAPEAKGWAGRPGRYPTPTAAREPTTPAVYTFIVCNENHDVCAAVLIVPFRFLCHCGKQQL